MRPIDVDGNTSSQDKKIEDNSGPKAPSRVIKKEGRLQNVDVRPADDSSELSKPGEKLNISQNLGQRIKLSYKAPARIEPGQSTDDLTSNQEAGKKTDGDSIPDDAKEQDAERKSESDNMPKDLNNQNSPSEEAMVNELASQTADRKKLKDEAKNQKGKDERIEELIKQKTYELPISQNIGSTKNKTLVTLVVVIVLAVLAIIYIMMNNS